MSSIHLYFTWQTCIYSLSGLVFFYLDRGLANQILKWFSRVWQHYTPKFVKKGHTEEQVKKGHRGAAANPSKLSRYNNCGKQEQYWEIFGRSEYKYKNAIIISKEELRRRPLTTVFILTEKKFRQFECHQTNHRRK